MAEFIGQGCRNLYVGTLHEINSESSTVALENVVSWGTEGRDPDNEVPPSETVYEYIVFRGSDVKDLKIQEQPKENKPPNPPQVPDDPAILGSARRPAVSESAQQPQQEPQAPFAPPPKEQNQQAVHNQQQQQHRQQQPPRFPQQSPFPPYYHPYGPPPPNQRFGPQGFPPGQGYPGMPYGAPPPGWYPPPNQGFPHQGYGHFPPPQMPIGSSNHQSQQGPHQQQAPPNLPTVPQEQSQTQQKSPNKPVATVKLPSSSTTPAPVEAVSNGPPPPTESKPNIAAALAPPAPTTSNEVPTTEKNTQATQKNGRIVPAIPRVSPAVKPAIPVNGALQSNQANIPRPQTHAKSAEPRPTQVATKSIEDANRDARAAVAAAMAKLPPAPGAGQPQTKKPTTTGTKKEGNQNSSAMDNLTDKVNEMRASDNIRTSRQPGTGGYAAGHRGGRNSYRGNRSRNDSQTKKVEVPTTDYDFETANAKFNKQDLVKEAIASGSPLGSPLDGANDIPDATPMNLNGDRKASEASVSVTPAVVGYNKTASFFDNISSESKEREEGAVKKGGREFRTEEVRKNLETFGQGSVDGGRGGYRGRGRARGYGGRGRGYAGNGRGRGGTRGVGRTGVVAES
ncbi:MAG: hypothetical protein LQ339_004362 [Xanthoria mediterranea]|nr:MAG: hypothetical protein LQ339_004362 [Xanthoria mediterranea]